jgi:hypothetical protein
VEPAKCLSMASASHPTIAGLINSTTELHASALPTMLWLVMCVMYLVVTTPLSTIPNVLAFLATPTPRLLTNVLYSLPLSVDLTS